MLLGHQTRPLAKRPRGTRKLVVDIGAEEKVLDFGASNTGTKLDEIEAKDTDTHLLRTGR